MLAFNRANPKSPVCYLLFSNIHLENKEVNMSLTNFAILGRLVHQQILSFDVAEKLKNMNEQPYEQQKHPTDG
jgi:hypothetical protein